MLFLFQIAGKIETETERERAARKTRTVTERENEASHGERYDNGQAEVCVNFLVTVQLDM